MKMFMVKVRWSATDSANYLVYAATSSEAIEKTKVSIPTGRYYEACGEMVGEIS